MHSWTRRLTGIAAAWLLSCGIASAQSLDHLQLHYSNGLPVVLLGGLSPYFWDDIPTTVTVSGRSISIVLQTPDAGFSVIWNWSLVVPLPPLMERGRHDITVALGWGGGGAVSDPIGYFTPAIFDPRGPDPIFRSAFE